MIAHSHSTVKKTSVDDFRSGHEDDFRSGYENGSVYDSIKTVFDFENTLI